MFKNVTILPLQLIYEVFKIIILDFITPLLSSILLIYIIYKLVKGNFNTIYIAYIGFYIFFILPIILDFLIGLPNYYYVKNFSFVGFIVSQEDISTKFYYQVFILIISILFLFFGKSKSISINKIEIIKHKKIIKIFLTIALIVITLLPTFLVINFNFKMGMGFNMVLNYDYLRL